MLFTVSNETDTIQPRHKNAIVTAIIGEAHRNIWEDLARESWEKYADAFGYDIIAITSHIDRSEQSLARSPAWQKLLILDQPWSDRYERIVWIDADIVISSAARYDISESVPDPRKVGLIRSGDQMSASEKHIYFERIYGAQVSPQKVEQAWANHIRGQYRASGIDVDGIPMLSTGVMVTSPQHHRSIFREIYQEKQVSALYEQPALSRRLVEADLYTAISPRFNWDVHFALTLAYSGDSIGTLDMLRALAAAEFYKSYFLHFAGSMQTMQAMAALPPAERWALNPALVVPSAPDGQR